MTTTTALKGLVGVAIQAQDSATAVSRIVAAEDAGIDSTWLTLGGLRGDSLTTAAAAAVRTDRIGLGTAIVPTWPRHPLAIAQQVIALEALAPGRVVLGIGPGTAKDMRPYGVEFADPLEQLREYLLVLRSFLQDGEIDHEGVFVKAHARIPDAPGTPVMMSALNAPAFELCGEHADGAITWVCPPDYIAEVGAPAMTASAQAAGRPPPPIVLHVPVAVGAADEVVALARSEMASYLASDYFGTMLARCGFSSVESITADTVPRLVAAGDRDAVADRLLQLTALGHVMAMPITDRGRDAVAFQKGLAAIGDAAQAAGNL